MNDVFVSIKVDREERPDIDGIYMSVCQMLTRSGGWPLTIVMTPDRKPFFAGTYFPRDTRHGRIGMTDLVPRIARLWRESRGDVYRSADRITEALVELEPDAPGDELDPELLHRAFTQLSQAFDERHGGFHGAPKFPTPHNLSFLLRHHARTGDPRALHMVTKTLREMRQGGIFDHLGLGFHRYSTDREWLVPHFEKMLYDQALLAIAYIETFQVTKDPFFRTVAEEIFAYVLRDLTDPAGGFYSAEDADSEGEEGLFYLWTEAEIEKALGAEAGRRFIAAYGVTEEGNFLEESTRARTGRNILHLDGPLEEAAARAGADPAELAKSRDTLFGLREARIHPHKDDKILTDWNGLMIAALARGARVFGREDLGEAAAKAADFLLTRVRDEAGRLLHVHREGRSGVTGNLDDHAFLIQGLLDLFAWSHDPARLERALELQAALDARFWDDRAGGYFFTADDAEALIARRKDPDDGAIPAGNSIAMLNLLRLARLTGNPAHEARAADLGRALSERVERWPPQFTQLLCALEYSRSPSREVVIAGTPGKPDTEALLEALAGPFPPHVTVILKPPGEAGERLAKLAPYLAGHVPIEGRAAAYVCRDFACNRPVTDPLEMLKLLD